MKMRNFGVVFCKEIKDIFRDRKSLFAAFIVPLLLYPLLMLFMGGGLDGLFTADETVRIAVVDIDSGYEVVGEDLSQVKAMFALDEKVVVESGHGDLQSATNALVKGKISVVLRVEKGICNILSEGNYRVDTVVDNRSTDALSGAERVNALIRAYRQAVYDARVEQAVGGDILASLECITSGENVSADEFITRSGTDNSLILMLIPIAMTLVISVGGSSVAVDLVAGEKERGTFEPLLSTATGRFSIMTAKYAVVLTYAAASALCQIASIAIGIALSGSALYGGKLSISFGGVVMATLSVLLLAALFCSIMLVLSATAKSFKEAGAKTSLMVYVPLVLAYFTVFTDAVDVGILNMICPVTNVCFVIKMVLSGVVHYPYFAVCLASNVVYVGIALWVTLKVFACEKLIGRT